MGKIAGVMVAMFQAYQNVDDAKRNLDVANQNLAQAYADLLGQWRISSKKSTLMLLQVSLIELREIGLFNVCKKYVRIDEAKPFT